MIIKNLDDLPKLPGVYLIYTPNKERNPYCGSSTNVWKRFYSHYRKIEKIKENRPIINAIKKYGIENCRIEIFHYWENLVDKLELEALETAVIDEYKCLKEFGGYNILLFGFNRSGIKASYKTITNQSKRMKGDGNFMYGKKHKMESIEKFKLCNKAERNPKFDHKKYIFKNKLTNETFIGTRYDFYKRFNLKTSGVNMVVRGDIKSYKKWTVIS